MSLKVCPWKHGKRWVYSITYDEALADLHRFAIPIHEEFGFPGHVEAVVGQLGEVRQIGNSSYNGFRHMNGGELQDLPQLELVGRRAGARVLGDRPDDATP